jgi:hypothetical protein
MLSQRALFNRMMTADLMPDTVTYTTLMKAAIADDNYQAAVRLPSLRVFTTLAKQIVPG